MQRIREIATCLLFLLACITTYTQGPSLYFEKINTQSGLSHNKVNCILQDERGFIWIGTEDGLNRYDGKNFVVFRSKPGDTTTISGNIITAIHQDTDEVIWIATADGGLSSYDYRLPPDNQFKQYRYSGDNPSTTSTNIINAMVEDRSGSLWLATSGNSVLVFDKQKRQFTKPVLKESGRTVMALCIDKDGVIWAGRQGGGLLKIDPVTLKYEDDERYENLYAQLPHAAVTSLFKDKQNNIWFGSWDNVLYRYNYREKKEEFFSRNSSSLSFNNDEVTSFTEDRRGRIWMGGKENGLQVYDRETGNFYNYRYDPAREGTIADNHINCIYSDNNGRLWIGTDRGISLSIPFKRQFVQTFLSSVDDKTRSKILIYDFYEDEGSGIWIGTSEGIFISRNGKIIHKPLYYKGHKLAVTSFFKSPTGQFYIGTDYSLFGYDPATDRLSLLLNTEKDQVMKRIIDSRVVSVIADTIKGNPVLLTAPYGHYLAYYDLVQKKWISRLDSTQQIVSELNLRDNLIRKFVRAKNGTIWLATGKMGLGMWSKDMKGVTYLSSDPAKEGTITNNNVFDIKEDSKGNLWVSTYGGGLHYFNAREKTFEHISTSNNLVEGLQIDDEGNVWMVSNGSLHKYDPKRNSFSNYDLPDFEKTGGIKGNIFRDNRGRMYVSGTNYFIRFHPDSIRGRQILPNVYITDFSIFNTSYSHLIFKDKIDLSYNKNYFTIEFAAPDFSSSGGVVYSYQLEGFDGDWIEAGTRNYVSYSNLQGGTYIFKVRATNTPGVWDEEYASVTIVITPPFWKQWWFFLTVALVISSIVYVIYRYRINELIRRQAIRNKIAQDLHDSVGSTLSSISVYSQVAKIQHQKGNDAELDDVLQKIGITSNDMISDISDIVWTINPRNDSMEKIFQRMESFAKPILQSKGIIFEMRYDKALLHVNLSMEKRKNFYLIFKEAINNTLKYSACKMLEVKIIYQHGNIQMTIKDDGKGFDMEQMEKMAAKSLSGNGLGNMIRRAEEMKGSCRIESAPGLGVTVLLRFPVT